MVVTHSGLKGIRIIVHFSHDYDTMFRFGRSVKRECSTSAAMAIDMCCLFRLTDSRPANCLASVSSGSNHIFIRATRRHTAGTRCMGVSCTCRMWIHSSTSSMTLRAMASDVIPLTHRSSTSKSMAIVKPCPMAPMTSRHNRTRRPPQTRHGPSHFRP